MKKVAILAILTVLFLTKAYSQEPNIIEKYNNTVHMANVNLCSNKLIEAKKYFDIAFSIASPFFTDLNNALIVEVNQNHPDTSRIIDYLKKIQQKGVCVHEKYKKRTSVIPFLQLIDEVDCNAVKNKAIKEIIDSAISKDQAIRDYSLEKFNDVYPQEMLAEINKIDLINFFQIDSILHVLESNKMMLEDVVGMSSFYSCMTILLHNVSWNREDTSLLIRLAQKRLVESTFIALELDHYCRAKKYFTQQPQCSYFGYYGTNLCTITLRNAYIIIPPQKAYEEITNNRRNLFLPDMIEEAKIRAFIAFKIKQGFDYGGIDWYLIPQSEENEFEKELRAKNRNVLKYEKGKNFDFDGKY